FLDPNIGSSEDEAADKPRAERLETDRMWVLEDRGQFVGNGGVRTMDVTVPGPPGGPCPILPMGGVTAVGIHPTHRRRGFLSQMMAEMLDDCRRRGEPLAGLIASESVIYGRFGFGLATDCADYRIDSSRSSFKVAPRQSDVQLIDHAEAAKVLPGIFEAARKGRAGEPGRSQHAWEEVFADKPADRQGKTGSFFAVCDNGYARYRGVWGSDTLRAERVEVIVDEVQSADPEVQAVLWRFVLDLDLIGPVTFRRRPLDEPVRWRLADPRQLQTSAVYDRLYLRILDVPATLTARGYRAESGITIEVLPDDVGGDDPAVGFWRLDAGPDGATCSKVMAGAEADLRLKVTALGSLYLGGVSATTLAAAGLIEALTPRSLATADRLFATTPVPSTVTGF
ncbi:MAG TPA: GNAT family N-acetyltransferase, partial [Acidimicrobiales bacterium]|nr:GNAT family N-acetyltransferase [Acidimicrobiales bacterium]